MYAAVLAISWKSRNIILDKHLFTLSDRRMLWALKERTFKQLQPIKTDILAPSSIERSSAPLLSWVSEFICVLFSWSINRLQTGNKYQGSAVTSWDESQRLLLSFKHNKSSRYSIWWTSKVSLFVHPAAHVSGHKCTSNIHSSFQLYCFSQSSSGKYLAL